MLQVEPLTKEQKREFYSQYTKEALIEFIIQREEAIKLFTQPLEHSDSYESICGYKSYNIPIFPKRKFKPSKSK